MKKEPILMLPIVLIIFNLCVLVYASAVSTEEVESPVFDIVMRLR